MANRIQLRRDTAGNWQNINPILADGEMGVEWDTGFIKVGDGNTYWNNLDYNTVSKDIPQRTININGGYELQLSDRGRHIYNTNYGPSISVPTNAQVAFPIGTTITIITNETYGGYVSALNYETTRILVPGVAYTDSGYDLPTASLAVLIKVGTDLWYLSGYGITQG
jgi:hypothetical protein